MSKRHLAASCISAMLTLGFSSGVLAQRELADARLTAEQAKGLEQSLEANPDDMDARAKLLAYYMMQPFGDEEAQKRHSHHVLWVIAHHPDAPVAGTPYAGLDAHADAKAYAQARELWLRAVKEQDRNPQVLSNAANFFIIGDHKTAETLLLQGQALEPQEARWPEELGELYMRQASGLTGEVDAKLAAQALEAYRRAANNTEPGLARSDVELEAARAAMYAGELAQARDYATKALERLTGAAPQWNTGNIIHHGNLVLGQVSLREGDLPAAERYLLEAGKTPGSPQLGSFGPNMALALELLKRGRQDSVVEYLQLCGKFWKKASTEAWIKSIQAGEIPDFGANLLY